MGSAVVGVWARWAVVGLIVALMSGPGLVAVAVPGLLERATTTEADDRSETNPG